MNGRAEVPAAVNEAIAVDEIGIETGVFGTFRLRSCYRPIFARKRDALVPVAVAGLIVPHRNGRPISPERFFAALGPEQVAFIDDVCLALHVRNIRNIGVDALDLYLKYDPRGSCGVRLLAGLLAESGKNPWSVVVEISEPATLESAVLWRLAEALREIGARLAIDGFGMEPSAHDNFDLIRPDIVRIDAGRLATLCRDAATARLFGLLVSGFRDRGARIYVAGIENAAHMRAALLAGADLFSGDHLAAPTLVGIAFNEAPVSITGLMEPETGVLRLVR